MKTRNMRQRKRKGEGFTLIEVLITMALLAVIAVSFIPLFALSARTSSLAENKLDATHSGKDAMELLYHLSDTMAFEEMGDELVARGYLKSAENSYTMETSEKKLIEITLEDQGDLIRVITKVYEDGAREKMESKYESYYTAMDGEG